MSRASLVLPATDSMVSVRTLEKGFPSFAEVFPRLEVPAGVFQPFLAEEELPIGAGVDEESAEEIDDTSFWDGLVPDVEENPQEQIEQWVDTLIINSNAEDLKVDTEEARQKLIGLLHQVLNYQESSDEETNEGDVPQSDARAEPSDR